MINIREGGAPTGARTAGAGQARSLRTNSRVRGCQAAAGANHKGVSGRHCGVSDFLAHALGSGEPPLQIGEEGGLLARCGAGRRLGRHLLLTRLRIQRHHVVINFVADHQLAAII